MYKHISAILTSAGLHLHDVTAAIRALRLSHQQVSAEDRSLSLPLVHIVLRVYCLIMSVPILLLGGFIMAGYLIKDTTRQEREQIVADSLGNIDAYCDGCMCGITEMYQDYIDGKKELREINMEFNARYVRDEDMDGRK